MTFDVELIQGELLWELDDNGIPLCIPNPWELSDWQRNMRIAIGWNADNLIKLEKERIGVDE
jgi:hypothetical protein